MPDMSKLVRCYDHPDFSDRYTVVYLKTKRKDYYRNQIYYGFVGMNDRPFHPQGIGQHGECSLGPHLGNQIAFDELPEDCQKLVMADLESLAS